MIGHIDVLLINPPREIPQKPDYPPTGLAYIAGILNKNKIKTKIIEASAMSWDKLKNSINYKYPFVVGIPCWTNERGQSFKLAKGIREKFPFSKIIVGGHHATAFPEHIFKLTCADAVVLGEGEESALELVRALLNGDNLNNIRGIAFKDGEKVIITTPRSLIDDLDSIPFPCYEGLDLDGYNGPPETKGRSAGIITSRGCPHRCIYCSSSRFWMQKWRARSANNVLEEIEWLYKDYGIRNIFFFDDNFTVRKERTIEICKGIIQRGLDIKWISESHVTHIDKEILFWMKKSGCYRIEFGVESGSLKILKNIKKRQTVEQIQKAFELTHEAGIKPKAYLIVGSPGECESTIKETIDVIKRIKPYDSMGSQILQVLPNTEIYDSMKSRMLINDDYWLRNDSTVYYTLDHDIRELKSLRNQLLKGISDYEGSLRAYIRYLIKKTYYKYAILQKLRRFRGFLGY
jgi:anaerobic magnesium-protoporphyrin IX monomethyl ester cyclase